MREEIVVVVGGIEGEEDRVEEEDAVEDAEIAKREEDKELEDEVALTESMMGLVSIISRACGWHWVPSEAEHPFKCTSSV